MGKHWKGGHRVEFDGLDEFGDYELRCSCGWMAGGGGLELDVMQDFGRRAFKRHQADPHKCAECA